jgi:hypothetical protein
MPGTPPQRGSRATRAPALVRVRYSPFAHQIAVGNVAQIASKGIA